MPTVYERFTQAVWFERWMFAFHWSTLPAPVDWDNIRTGEFQCAMLDWSIASVSLCRDLKNAGIVAIAVRLWPEDYSTETARNLTINRLVKLQDEGVCFLVIGREPENAYGLTYNDDWHGGEAFVVRDAILEMNRRALVLHSQQRPLWTVSPGLTYRGHYTNWDARDNRGAGLQPGEYTWLEILRPALDECSYNGFHSGGSDGTEYDITERMKDTIHEAQERYHRNLFIDEIVISRGTPVQRMTTYLRVATKLLERRATNVAGSEIPLGGAGERVRWLCPFISLGEPGEPPAWPRSQLLRDPDCYPLVRAFMRGGNF
jgi:hypothetical protein